MQCFSPALHHFISFHILSGFALKKCYLADVSVCFWLLWGGFKRLFLFFVSLLKENPLGFYKPSVPHGLTAQTYVNGKQCLFDCSLIPEKMRVFIKFNGTVWKEKFLIT